MNDGASGEFQQVPKDLKAWHRNRIHCSTENPLAFAEGIFVFRRSTRYQGIVTVNVFDGVLSTPE